LRAGTDDLVILGQAIASKEGKIMTSFTSSLLSRIAAEERSRRGKARSVRSRSWRDLSARPRLEVLEDRTLLSGSGPTSAAVQASYAQLPLAFEANQGQAAVPINFVAHGSGYTLALTPGEAVLALQKPASTAGPQASGTPGDVVQLQLVGANPTAPVTGLDELITKSNYFIGNDPSQWRTNVPNFGKVEYQNVYPGINLVYYGNQGQLEYDFVVAPGTKPGAITLSLQGTQGITLDSQGNLLLHTAGGDVLERAPVLYQEMDGVRQAVSGRFVLEGNNQVGFQVGAYDPSRPLVIDPVLSYSTFFGGSYTWGSGIALDAWGNAYITGSTEVADIPTTPGAFQTLPTVPGNMDLPPAGSGLYGGGWDAFVAELNPAGTARVYCTYLGGGLFSDTFGNGIAVDASGHAYVTGFTDSGPDSNGYNDPFPTTPGAFQTSGGSAFVTELNPTLSGAASLVYSTYLGGSNIDWGSGIAVDSSGDAYITGYTTSSDFPTTSDAYQRKFLGNASEVTFNAFVAKLNPTVSGTASLVYSTYLGGSGGANGNGIAVDNAGRVYLTGSAGANFPMVNAYQTTCGSNGNAFVAKLDTNISGTQSLVYSTYLGGSGTINVYGGSVSDSGNGIAVDASGNAYVTGSTNSSDFPTSPNAFQRMYGGNGNAFVAKLNTTASGAASLVYSTYLGGSGGDAGNGIAIDALGNAYVTGGTSSTDFPTTAGALQMTYRGGFGFGVDGDAFVAKLNANGTALLYSTYLGGSAPDSGSGIAVDASGDACVTGSARSSDFPTTMGAYLTAAPFPPSAGAVSSFVTKLTLSPTVTIVANQTMTTSTVSLTLTASDPNSADQEAGFTYTVNWGDGSAVYTSPPNQQVFTVPVSNGHSYNPGAYLVQVTATDQNGNTGPVGTVVVVVGTPSGGDSITLTGGSSFGDVSILFNNNQPPFDSQGVTQGVFVWGQGGSDTYTVNLGSTLITPISIVGSGSDTLIVNGSTSSNTITVSNTQVAWVSHVAETVSYSGIKNLSVYDGTAGNDTVTVNSTSTAGVTINGQGGADNYLVYVGSLAGPVAIVDNGPTTADSLSVFGISGQNTSSAWNKTADTITWSNPNSPSTPAETISFTNANVTIYGDSANNSFTDPGSQNTTLVGGPGTNTFVIGNTAGNGVVADGGPGSNTFIINMGNLLGPVTINSTSGTSTVTVNGPPGSNVLTLTSTQLTGDGENINFNLGNTATNLSVVGGGGNNNQLVIQGTPPAPLSVQNVVLPPGVSRLGTQVFIVGGNTSNDQVRVTPVGTSMTGSTGVQVRGILNGVATTMTFTQAVTDLEIVCYSGNNLIQLALSLTVSATISAGNGNDTVQAGSGPITVTLGNGNDTVLLGNGANTVTLGNGNDTVLLGNGNNVVVTGNGTDTILAGNGNNLIAAGLGQHTVLVGNGSNILIDGTVTLTQSGDSLRQVLTDWISYLPTPTKANIASIRARLQVTYNTSHANTLLAGSGLDWFWETYAKDTTDRKASDLLN
jgi:Ca2+-binding RTX toxin-like protein